MQEETSIPKNGEENGHRYIDLDLPSGTKWADCNIGASSPTEYGDYFAWGEINPKEEYNWKSYKFGTEFQLTKYCTNSNSNSIVDNDTELYSSDDVAKKRWGSKWRIPSDKQFDELCNWTFWHMQIINGVWGLIFESRRNGNQIFLPAAGSRTDTKLINEKFQGLYWTRMLYDKSCAGAFAFAFEFFERVRDGYISVEGLYDERASKIGCGRYWGFTIRPVCSEE